MSEEETIRDDVTIVHSIKDSVIKTIFDIDQKVKKINRIYKSDDDLKTDFRILGFHKDELGILSSKPGEIKVSWEALKDWLTQNYGSAQCEFHELPFKHQLKNGQIVTGSMDFVWETDKGCVLVDYKTSPCTRENLINKDSDVHAGKYKGQLECYEQALVAAGKKVLAKILYYPVVGVVVKL